MKRKPTSLTMVHDWKQNDDYWASVCDDGSMWVLWEIDQGWARLPDIPQSDPDPAPDQDPTPDDPG